ncbi:hypothetical protein [Streptomyces virginiae]
MVWLSLDWRLLPPPTDHRQVLGDLAPYRWAGQDDAPDTWREGA